MPIMCSYLRRPAAPSPIPIPLPEQFRLFRPVRSPLYHPRRVLPISPTPRTSSPKRTRPSPALSRNHRDQHRDHHRDQHRDHHRARTLTKPPGPSRRYGEGIFCGHSAHVSSGHNPIKRIVKLASSSHLHDSKRSPTSQPWMGRERTTGSRNAPSHRWRPPLTCRRLQRRNAGTEHHWNRSTSTCHC